MLCPVCDQVRLKEVEREGVLIDVCPSCKGVWLDRGELEKLIQDSREARKEYAEAQPYSGRNDMRERYDREDKYAHHDKHYDDKYRKYDYYGKPKKKKRMFDIFDDLF